MKSVSRGVKVGVLSVIPNLRNEIAKRLPTVQDRITDCLEKNGLTAKYILEIAKDDRETCKNLGQRITGDCNVLVADPDLLTPFIYDLNHIKWVQSTWDGVDALTKYIDHGKPYPSWKMTRFSVFGQHMAEYVIGNIIAVERNFKQLFSDQAAKEWKPAKGYRLLNGLTIGLLGVGDIGSNVAKAAKAFGMTVVGVVSQEITQSKMLPFVDQYYFSLDHLPEVLQKCDYICNSLPKTPETDAILMNGILENCKEKRGILINIGRGNIINEEELLKALDSKWIGGAILDVFEKEPLPKTSALWDAKNVVITPHCSGQSFDVEVADFFVKNLEIFLRNDSLSNMIDWKRGY